MRLFLLRHAHAESSAASDHNRRLTAEGIEKSENAGRVLATLNLKPARIYSSPRLRARETAEIVARALGQSVSITEAVNFGFNLRAVSDLIKDLDDDADVMFVGHNPTFSMVVQELTGADVQMKRCGLARIDVYSYSPLRGELVWLIPPAVFGALIED